VIASDHVCAHVVFTWLKPYFKVCALIFYMCEGLSQAIANQLNMQKLWHQYFLTMKATIFDTHGINCWWNWHQLDGPVLFLMKFEGLISLTFKSFSQASKKIAYSFFKPVFSFAKKKTCLAWWRGRVVLNDVDYLDDSFSQFHQHFTCAFFDDILAPKIYKAKWI